MRIGVCVNMFVSEKDPAGLGVLQHVKDAGFDYAELPAAQMLALPDGELEREVQRIKALGIATPSFNNLFQAGIRLTGPDVDDGLVDAYLDRALDLAKRLGVETLVFGSAAARNIPMGFPFAKAWEQAVGMLRRLGPKAEKIGATVVIEHMNKLEGNLGTSFRDCVKMMREVNLPSVRSLVDYFHIGLGNEGMEYVDENFDLICHAHFANVLGRTMPVEGRHEEGVLKYLALFKKKNYQFKLSVEGYSNDPAKEIVQAAEFLRKRM